MGGADIGEDAMGRSRNQVGNTFEFPSNLFKLLECSSGLERAVGSHSVAWTECYDRHCGMTTDEFV